MNERFSIMPKSQYCCSFPIIYTHTHTKATKTVIAAGLNAIVLLFISTE